MKFNCQTLEFVLSSRWSRMSKTGCHPACLLVKSALKQKCQQCKIWFRCGTNIHAFHEYAAALAFIASLCVFCWLELEEVWCVSQLKLKLWIESLFMSLEVSLVLVSTSLQTLPFWNGAIPQTHLRIPLVRPLGRRIMNSFVRWNKVIHFVFRNITEYIGMVLQEGRVHGKDKSVGENS